MTRNIIDGITYDTDAARFVYSRNNGQPGTQPGFWYKSLYRLPDGSWFLHHQGGPESHYGRWRNGRLIGDDYIEPVSNEDAWRLLWQDEQHAIIAREFPSLHLEKDL